MIISYLLIMMILSICHGETSLFGSVPSTAIAVHEDLLRLTCTFNSSSTNFTISNPFIIWTITSNGWTWKSPRILLSFPSIQIDIELPSQLSNGRYRLIHTLQLHQNKDDTVFLPILVTPLTTILQIVDENDGWDIIFQQLVLNLIIFIIGMGIWSISAFPSSAPTGRSRGQNKDEKQHGELQPLSLGQRMKWFFTVSCEDPRLLSQCGINAILNMRWHRDTALFCTGLSILAMGGLMPVHYHAAGVHTNAVDSFHLMSISNVRIGSPYFWCHVAVAYLVAFGILYHLYSQMETYLLLQSWTKSLVGPRTCFIASGIPPNIANNREWKTVLRTITNMDSYEDDCIEEAVLLPLIGSLYPLLTERVDWMDEYERLQTMIVRRHAGELSTCLRICPGSFFVPTLSHISSVFRSGYVFPPRRNNLRREGMSSIEYHALDDAIDFMTPYESKRLHYLHHQLNRFHFEKNQFTENLCHTGAGFVKFRTVAKKESFLVQLKKLQKENITRNNISLEEERTMIDNIYSSSSLSTNSTKYLLRNWKCKSAPEPDDIRWPHWQLGPLSLRRLCILGLYQVASIIIVLIFSTPTALLNFFHLDTNSSIYAWLKEGSGLLLVIATYLPPLLLILGNFLILTILFYISEFEPWKTESGRMKSFMRKGFSYLILSSIVLPSIAVTSIYVGTTSIDFSKNYIEIFLNSISGTFFITYVCQRTFLSSMVTLNRWGERFFYLPWLKARALTPSEQEEAHTAWPFYFGSDYAITLSVFMVIVVGSIITPILSLFGALYFIVKFWTVKYQFVYVVPYAPGRGELTLQAYSLMGICLLLFEGALVCIIGSVGTSGQWLALLFLVQLTVGVGFYFVSHYVSRLTRVEMKEAVDDDKVPLEIKHSRVQESYVNPYGAMYDLIKIETRQRRKQIQGRFQKWKNIYSQNT